MLGGEHGDPRPVAAEGFDRRECKANDSNPFATVAAVTVDRLRTAVVDTDRVGRRSSHPRLQVVSTEFNTTRIVHGYMSGQTTSEDTDGEMAALRDEYPSGWRVLTQHESVGYMIDALMYAPDYHFSKSKLAEQAGVSRQSVHTHLPLLRRLGIVSVVEDSSPEQYTLDSGDELVRELHRLNGLVNEKLDDG